MGGGGLREDGGGGDGWFGVRSTKFVDLLLERWGNSGSLRRESGVGASDIRDGVYASRRCASMISRAVKGWVAGGGMGSGSGDDLREGLWRVMGRGFGEGVGGVVL